MEYPFISVVIPVKNEGALLRQALLSLQKLDYPRDRLEIVIADGLSSDNTREVASEFGAKIVRNQKQIVASGRNCGFAASRGELIAFTDADCLFDAGWLKNCLKYFQEIPLAGVGGRTLPPDDSSGFEQAIDLVFSLAEIFKSTAHRSASFQAHEVNDIPGCNAIYRRSALEMVMPVDEGLLTAEDVWMNSCLKKKGFKLIMAPDVILWHYRRNRPKRFLRQMYRFAIGRLQVGKKCPALISPSHLLAGLGLPILLTLGIILFLRGTGGIFLRVLLVFFISAGLLAFVRTKSWRVALNVPWAAALFLCGWSIGFLKEFFFPLKDAKGK